MKRLLTVLAVVGAFVAVPATAEARTPRPVVKAAVVISSLTQQCGAGGYDTVDLGLTANATGTYDVNWYGDNQFWSGYVTTVTLAAGEQTLVEWSPGYPQQLDVVVTDDATGRTVAERAVGSPTACARPW